MTVKVRLFLRNKTKYKISSEPENKDKVGEEPMHEIRKPLGKNECDGKSLLSLSIQFYAGHGQQTKVTIFSGEREKGGKQGWCKIWLLSPRIKSKAQLVHGPA